MPFTRRDRIQDEVEFHLFQQRSILYLDSSSQPKHQPRVVLTGDSSVGKTAIAARLAHQINEERPGCSVFWIDASDIRSVSNAYCRIWMTTERPGNIASVETSLVYYLNWVFGDEWLMILDGINGQTLHCMQLEGWLPSGLGGRLLLTTKDASCLSLLGQATEVRVPPEEEELPFPVIPALPPSRPEDFDVAIICLSRQEYNAIHSLFAQLWKGDPRDYGKANDELPRHSENLLRYCAGRIYGCNAVLALGAGLAEIIAADIRSSFKRIQLTLLVGTCSGLPWADNESTKGIFRGDIVISNEVVRYRLSNPNTPGDFEKDIIPPNEHVRPLLDIMESGEGLERVRKNTAYFLKHLQATGSADIDFYAYPGVVEDKLFRLSYPHKHHGSPDCLCHNDVVGICPEALDSSCDALGCDNQYLIDRERAQRGKQPGPHNIDRAQEPSLYCGRIAYFGGAAGSPDERDVVLSTDSSILALITAAPATSDSLPYIYIQGVRDYADFHNWRMWSNFAAATAASAAKAILGEYSRLSPWMVPFSKEAHFIGREEVLARILSKIPPGISEDSCQRTAIVGPEGIGKTQVVLEAVRLFHRQHPDCSVFWISGRSADDLNDGFRGIGRRLRVSKISEDDLGPGEDMISRVTMELDRSSAGNWLLIIDNVNDGTPNILTDWVPSSPNGSVILISRHHVFGVPERDMIPVPPMNGEEATEMLRRYVHETQLGNKTSMIDLLDKLQYSPLAIIQAGAVISASGTSAIQNLQHALESSKNATTQPRKDEEQQETDREDQADQQTIKPQLVPPGETHASCHFRGCTFTCSSKDALHEHAALFHTGQHFIVSRSRPCKCSCGQEFTKFYSLERHVRVCGGEKHPEFGHPCPKCPTYQGKNAFIRKDHLLQHYKYFHKYTDDQLIDLFIPRIQKHAYRFVSPAICHFETCEYYRGPEFTELDYIQQEENRPFNKQSEYTMHMRQEHNWSPYPCQVGGCDKLDAKGYFSISALEKHYKEKHPGKQYSYTEYSQGRHGGYRQNRMPTTVAPLSDEVEDEAKEGVLGYLVPTQRDRLRDPVIVLRKRPAETRASVVEANPSNKGGQTNQKPEEGRPETARSKPNSSGRFLIGRHPECGKTPYGMHTCVQWLTIAKILLLTVHVYQIVIASLSPRTGGKRWSPSSKIFLSMVLLLMRQ